MSHIALAAPATATGVAAFHRSGARHPWTNLFPRIGRANSSPSFFANSASKPFQLRCSSSPGNGGLADDVVVSETQQAPSNFAWSDTKRPRVCILGGGFGGLYTALRLESLEWPDHKRPQVVLVDQSERFVFKPLLYEILSGEVDEWEIAPRFSDLLANTGVLFFKDRVKFLCPSDDWRMNESKASSCGGTVHLESGLLIEYDWYNLSYFKNLRAYWQRFCII